MKKSIIRVIIEEWIEDNEQCAYDWDSNECNFRVSEYAKEELIMRLEKLKLS